MKGKKVLCLIMVAVMMLGLVGCSSSTDKKDNNTQNDNNGDKKENGSEDNNTSDGDNNATEQTLKVAAVETAYGQQLWTDVCAAFEKANPGVKVELTIDKKLSDIITPLMKSGEYPDVILHSVGAESALTETFTKENNLIEMTDVLSMTIPGEQVTVKDKILPGFLNNSITAPYGDGKTYLMPMFYGPCGLFYNEGLFKEKNWEVPTTWEEMWALGDKAKEEGIALFTYPTAGYFDAFLYALLYEALGNENFQKALHYEEGIWDTPEVQQVFNIIEKLASYTEKTTPANANDNDYRKNQQLILENKALFMPNGNWVIGEMKDAPKAEGFKWAFMALPALTEGGERASYTYFEQVWMPKKAVNQELGKKFIAYLYSDEAAGIFAKGSNNGAIQPIKGMADKLEGDAKIYYSIYDTGAVAVMDAFATTEPVEGITVRTTFLDPINSLVSGDKTKDDWINQIKKDSKALREALK